MNPTDSPIATDFQRLMLATAITVDAISEALAIVVEAKKKDVSEKDLALRLTKHFSAIFPKSRFHSTGIDAHLVDGLHVKERGHTARPDGQYPRLVELVLLHTSEAFLQADQRGLAAGYILLPSPLYIAIEALTVPQEPHTKAYPLLAARMLLSLRLGVWPRNAFNDQVENSDSLIDENVIIEEIGNCRTWVQIGDSWSIKSDLKKSFVGNFMAMRGVLLMRLSEKDAIGFLRKGIFSKAWKESANSNGLNFQFRLAQKYSSLPPPSDFMNEILGVPVALRGMDNVFFNGIKPSVSAGLVIQLSGGPGTGKTTFALALAAALAPIGTQVLYFSFEEAEGDLVSKLRQQSQPRLNNLSFHQAPDHDWFKAFHIGSATLDAVESTLIAPLKSRIEGAKADFPNVREKGGLVPPLPFLVVLDSLSALSLYSDDVAADEKIQNAKKPKSIRQRLAKFVELCRELRVLVILVTSDDRTAWGELDYVVDMVIGLRVEGAEDHSKKPLRLFSLSKSRQQISRHGTHIFHLSGDSGFRLAPQLSSQMDAQQSLRQLLWDRSTFIEALNLRRTASGGYRHVKFLDLHWRSQILLQGRGSAGKAGLALRLALSPKYGIDEKNGRDGYLTDQASPRVLILSFLYPPSYYETLRQRLERCFIRETKTSHLRGFTAEAARKYVREMAPVDVIHLTPGSLHAEDLHSMVVRRLEEGRLSGRPYTATIIDGLHNLALQFPGASESSYLFPILYGTFSRANVTTITTFTTLAMNSSEFSGVGADSNEESVFRLRVHLPLLHTLVQASDYVLEVFKAENRPKNRPMLQASDDKNSVYLVKVQSAISRDPPTHLIGWDRQELEFVEPGWHYEDAQATLPME